MEELAGRLTALDPDAEAAVRVIAYFDRLVEGRAGLEALVRGAAVLSGSPARLIDTDQRVRIRIEPDGRRHDSAGTCGDRRTTAQKIGEDTDELVDVVIAGIGTGGTATGVGQVLNTDGESRSALTIRERAYTSATSSLTLASDHGSGCRPPWRNERPEQGAGFGP
ncbi:hypothetical protein NOGI109294_04335 [Nocardiopsis gilva]|uniref:hypothetical protein n=1 Tax=Nocardiopsis gilva TaxID=280236 RepID=UPI000349D25D|nr:hypothetical protein [Nocardiopsis gilva]